MDIQPQRPVRKVFWSSAQKLCEGVERTGFPGVADLASETFHVLRVSFGNCRDDESPFTAFQNIQTVRSNKKSRDRLAVRVSQIICVLKDAEEPTDTETSSYPLLDSLDQLRRYNSLLSNGTMQILTSFSLFRKPQPVIGHWKQLPIRLLAYRE